MYVSWAMSVFCNRGAKLWAKCWYSGWSLIVFGIKYIFAFLRCGKGCLLRGHGIGPGFVSMSPQSISFLR